MADSKSKVQETIELLQGMVEVLDRDIEIVEKNALKANKLNDAIAKGEQNGAVGRLNDQIAQIDDIILNDADISKFIGSAESEEVKKLNEAIKAVVEKVKRVKTWEFKDRSGNTVDIGIKTDAVKTDTVVSEVEKIERVTEDVDYDKVGDKVTELEGKIAKEELYQKFAATQAALGTEDVDKNYEKFNKEFAEKLNEYKALEALKSFPADELQSKVGGKFTLINNKADVEKLLAALKKAKGKTELTIPGINKSGKITIDKLTYDSLSKASNTTIANAMSALVAAAKVQDTELEAKVAEMSDVLRDNKSMQLLFTEDRDAIKGILDKKPINVAEVESILAEMSKVGGKNNKLFADMETYKSIGDIASLKRELARLKGLEGYIKAEETAKAVKHNAQEITEIEIAGEKIALKKDSYDRDFVDIKKKSELEDVMEATYANLEDETYNALVEKVENDAKLSGNRLPNRFFSGLLSLVTLGRYNPRRDAIEARVKGMISDSIISERDKSKAKAEGKQSLADEETARRTAEREKMTDFDKRLRVTEEDLAREAMRKQIVAGKGSVTAEAAKGGLNLDQIENDAKKKLEGEAR